MNGIIIFSAGKLGLLAKMYYEKKVNIICFVDNDSSLWETSIDGIKVKSPEILRRMDKDDIVVIANERNSEVIKEQIVHEYGVERISYFRFNIYHDYYIFEGGNQSGNDELILNLMGGLGNQMFIYATAKYLEKLGKNVTMDLSYYSNPLVGIKFQPITKIFRNLKINYCNHYKKEFYLSHGGEYIITENHKEYGTKQFINKVASLNQGIVFGYFQVADIVDEMATILRKDFELDSPDELNEIIKIINRRNTVSVHVRRGDYLNDDNKEFNVCNKYYFLKAINYIKSKIKTPLFVFFSDDIDFVKNELFYDNAIYIDNNISKRYKDWYDLYLMSLCSHHIISNSTFSWWGAWLNNKKNKIIIAPEKWTIDGGFQDIYPKGCIKI